ncbi:unnamed protein product, partial [Prorocentrum cordatum]
GAGGFTKDYKAGDDCRARNPDDERWYPGTVAEALGENIFRVKWDDPDGGEETLDVHAENMKKVNVERDYKRGDQVLGRFPQDGMIYPGTVTKADKDGAFTVKWADPDGGREESDVSPKDRKVPPIPFDSLEVGQEYQGTVRRARDFGAFVDIGAEGDGSVHISSISTERIDDIYSVLEEDQEVRVWISGLRDDGKFGLTMIEGKTDSDQGRRVQSDVTPFEGVSPDEWFEGEVVSTPSFGAFIVLTAEDGTEAQGLCHVSRITDDFVDNISDYVSVSQTVKVRVQSVDLDANKMSLSMREDSGHEGGQWLWWRRVYFPGARRPQRLRVHQPRRVAHRHGGQVRIVRGFREREGARRRLGGRPGAHHADQGRLRGARGGRARGRPGGESQGGRRRRWCGQDGTLDEAGGRRMKRRELERFCSEAVDMDKSRPRTCCCARWGEPPGGARPPGAGLRDWRAGCGKGRS